MTFNLSEWQNSDHPAIQAMRNRKMEHFGLTGIPTTDDVDVSLPPHGQKPKFGDGEQERQYLASCEVAKLTQKTEYAIAPLYGWLEWNGHRYEPGDAIPPDTGLTHPVLTALVACGCLLRVGGEQTAESRLSNSVDLFLRDHWVTHRAAATPLISGQAIQRASSIFRTGRRQQSRPCQRVEQTMAGPYPAPLGILRSRPAMAPRSLLRHSRMDSSGETRTSKRHPRARRPEHGLCPPHLHDE